MPRPLYRRWFRLGRTRESAQTPISLNEAEFEQCFAQSAVGQDQNSRILEGRGYRVGFWTGGADGQSCSIDILCGDFATVNGVNSCVLTLPFDGEAAERILRPEVLREMLAQMG